MTINIIEGNKASDIYLKLNLKSRQKVEEIASASRININYQLVFKAYIEERFSENEITKESQDKCSLIRNKCKELACFLVDTIPDSRELSTALTSLETTMFFAEAGIQRS
ncbi:hypothetical protein GCL60_16765 [Silvanigrella paludirubra]|uniref:Acb2/Tad1 hairpin domain-containing protein n=1 Tax=Silvanigrella paludirubra TaxID=2499159 RepID=A0A6N6VPE4_9BACT|nr:hypothetical protein [Silvanigrella paludirubra]KAB8035882.1 hypothetical protein GCL60_16765 [Silvanigrella paludirubra]